MVHLSAHVISRIHVISFRFEKLLASFDRFWKEFGEKLAEAMHLMFMFNSYPTRNLFHVLVHC